MFIDLCFAGWLRKVKLNYLVETATGNQIKVDNLTSQQIIEGLNTGKYTTSLTFCIQSAKDFDINMFDFQENKL